MLSVVANFLFAMREALPGHPDWCHSCCKLEPIPEGGAFEVCIECGHVYATAEDLLKRYNEECDRMDATYAEEGFSPIERYVTATEIFFCQECTHDF